MDGNKADKRMTLRRVQKTQCGAELIRRTTQKFTMKLDKS